LILLLTDYILFNAYNESYYSINYNKRNT